MTERDGRILLGFYGDDFTGSTDAMEVTAFAGLRTVLFTRTPDAAALSRFANYDVVGIAGTARARDPQWMDAHLPAAFEALRHLQPRIIHYKVCSTFDSSPEVGSIGRAIDIGLSLTGGSWSPSIVGAPQLGRWQVFGNLFAAAGGDVHRIDRHPTMSRHPITPMRESDLRIHLASQTDRPVECVFFTELEEFVSDQARSDCPVVFLDVPDEESQKLAGRIVWEASDEMLFSASSSGLQYALVAHWRQIGLISDAREPLHHAEAVDRLLVLSGSCSPVTAEQICVAEDAGFASLRLDVVAATTPELADAEHARLLAELDNVYQREGAAVVFAARTIDDPAYVALQLSGSERNIPFGQLQEVLGHFFAQLAHAAVERFGLRRLVVSGGDTSGRIVEGLPIDALEVVHPLVKGAPLCRCHSEAPHFDGLQISLKGGQMGTPDVFVKALRGASA